MAAALEPLVDQAAAPASSSGNATSTATKVNRVRTIDHSPASIDDGLRLLADRLAGR